jgi:hypothetical protein
MSQGTADLRQGLAPPKLFAGIQVSNISKIVQCNNFTEDMLLVHVCELARIHDTCIVCKPLRAD